MKIAKICLFVAASLTGMSAASAASLSSDTPVTVSGTLNVTPSYCELASTALDDTSVTTNQLKEGYQANFPIELTGCSVGEPVNVTVKPSTQNDAALKVTVGTAEGASNNDSATFTDSADESGSANLTLWTTIAAADTSATASELEGTKTISFDLTQDYTAQ